MKLFCLVLLALLWAAGSTYAQTPVMLSGGRIYEGDWRDDAMNGRGVLTLPNGERREGVFMYSEWRRP